MQRGEHAWLNRPQLVAAGQFGRMDWVIKKLGVRAVIAAGMGAKDRAREAIQLLSSTQIVERTVCTHTGWRKLRDGWVYLHGGGAIGARGAGARIETSLPAALALFVLPPGAQSSFCGRLTICQPPMTLRMKTRQIRKPASAFCSGITACSTSNNANCRKQYSTNCRRSRRINTRRSADAQRLSVACRTRPGCSMRARRHFTAR
jgi:hypothetical protein